MSERLPACYFCNPGYELLFHEYRQGLPYCAACRRVNMLDVYIAGNAAFERQRAREAETARLDAEADRHAGINAGVLVELDRRRR